MNTDRVSFGWCLALMMLAAVLLVPRSEAAGFDAAAWAELEDRAALVHVPEGTKRVRLQTRTSSTGKWIPVGIVHLEGRAGTVKLRLPDGVALANIAIETSAADPFPYSFYQGRNTFEAAPSSPPGGGRDGGLVAPNATTNDAETPDSPGGAAAVQESDIWKWRGRTLYYFNALRGLQVFDLTDFEKPGRVASLRMPAVGEDMYVLGSEHVVLLANRPHYSWEVESPASAGPRSEVVVVRHTGADLREVARIPIDGAFMESRLVGSTLCVLAQKVVAAPAPEGGLTYTPKQHVYALDLSDPNQPVVRGPLDVSNEEGAWWSWDPAVHATSEFLFVATNSWTPAVGAQTRLSVIDLRTPEKPLAVGAQFTLAGHLRTRFQIAYADGILTTVSEKDGAVIETWDLQRALLGSGPAAPRPLDSLMVGQNESLFATRFDGSRVYVVTFRRIDPLFCVDLSAPSDLRLLGELEVPGFSTYLEVFAGGSRLLSLGVEDSRVAVSLFDVADPAAPTLKSRVHFGDPQHWSWSEGNYDDKAIGYFRDAGLMLFPLEQWTAQHGYRSGMQLVDATADGLRARGFIDHRFSARRGRLFDQTLVSIGGYELIVLDVTNRDQPRKVSALTVAWPVQAVVPYGDSVAQFEDGELTAYPRLANDPPRTVRLRLTPKSDLDMPAAEIDLGVAGQVAGTSRRGDLMYVLVRSLEGRSQPGPDGHEVFDWSAIMTTVVIDLAAPTGSRVAGSSLSRKAGSSWGGGRLESHWLPDGRLLWYPAETTSRQYWWGCVMCDVAIGGGMALDGGFFGMPWRWGGSQPDDILVVDVADPGAPRVVVREAAVPATGALSSSRLFLSAESRLLVSWSTWNTTGTLWAEESFVQEIDLGDSAAPRRGPIATVPALVQGVHQTGGGGLVLIASRQETLAEPEKPAAWTNAMVVDALAYDGVHAFLLDTARLEGLAHMPTVASGPHFLVLRQPANEAAGAVLRPLRWDETSGKWKSLPDLAVAARWPMLHLRGGYLFVTDVYRTEILALHQLPEAPARTLQTLDTPVWDQSHLALDLPDRAAWLPVGAFGVARLDLSALPLPPTPVGRSTRDRDTAEWHPLALLPVDIVSVHGREGGTDPLSAKADFRFVPDGEAETYADWAHRHFPGSPLTIAGPAADPDGDGFDNYSEWAFAAAPADPGSQPQVTANLAPAEDGQPARLLLVARLNPLAGADVSGISSALTFIPQISTDLTIWRTPADEEVEVKATPIRRMWSLHVDPDATAAFGRLIIGSVIKGQGTAGMF